MKTKRRSRIQTRRQKGMALIATLWILAVLTVIVWGFTSATRTESYIAANYADSVRATELAKAGLQRAIVELEQLNSEYISTDQSWAKVDSDTDEMTFYNARYDVQGSDEGGKINLNAMDMTTETAGGLRGGRNPRPNTRTASSSEDVSTPPISDHEILTNLIGAEAADTLMDWCDRDNNPRPLGAESDYYMTLKPSYPPRNSPLETLEELLLVKGITAKMFTSIDPQTSPSDSFVLPLAERATLKTTPSMKDLMTIYSVEDNSDSRGLPRLNVASAGEDQFREKLGDTLTTEEISSILRYRDGEANQGMSELGINFRFRGDEFQFRPGEGVAGFGGRRGRRGGEGFGFGEGGPRGGEGPGLGDFRRPRGRDGSGFPGGFRGPQGSGDGFSERLGGNAGRQPTRIPGPGSGPPPFPGNRSGQPSTGTTTVPSPQPPSGGATPAPARPQRALRQRTVSSNSGTQVLSFTDGGTTRFVDVQGSTKQQPGRTQGHPFRSTGDLLGVPLSRDKLRSIADRITVSDQPTLSGRINVNTAPKEVLTAIPGISEQIANDIMSYRQGPTGPFRSVGDLLALPSITNEIYQQVADRLTVRSNAFRFVSEGWVRSTNTRKRIEAIVIIVTEEPARLESDQSPTARPSGRTSSTAATPTGMSGTVTPPKRKAYVVYWREL